MELNNLKQKSDESNRANSFREFVKRIEKEGILRLKEKVPPKELPRVLGYSLPLPLKFITKIEGVEKVVVSNVFSTKDLVAKYLGVDEKELLAKLAHAIENPSDPTEVPASEALVLQNSRSITSQASALQKIRRFVSNYALEDIIHSYISKNRSLLSFHTSIERTNGTTNAAIMLGIPPTVPLASALVNSLGIPHDPLNIANTLTPLKIVRLSNGIRIVADAEIVVVGTIRTIDKDSKPIEQEDINLKNIESTVMEVDKIHYRNDALLHIPTSCDFELLSKFVEEVEGVFLKVMLNAKLVHDVYKRWN